MTQNKRLLAMISTIFAVAMLAVPGMAETNDPDAHLMAGFQKLPSGLYRVPLADGTSVETHGYDPKPSHGSWSWISRSLLRQPLCATNYYFHILYGRLSSASDRYASQRGEILTAVKNTNYLLNSEGMESGGHNTDYKVLCDAYGEIDVGSFTAPTDGYQSVMDAARAAGYNKSNVKYWIFFDTNATNYCGVSNFRADETLSPSNRSNSGGTYSISHRDCWAGRTPMHEAGHAMGAVQYNAPASTGSGGHCNEDVDVMCYSPDGGDRNQSGTVDRCTDHIHYDCLHDSYFDTAPETGEYLESHWNVGDPFNRFLAFDGNPVAPTNRPPTSRFSWSCVNAACSFTDQSADFDGSIASRLWQFGDGTTSTASSNTHTYSLSGNYSVTLTVTDDKGATGVSTKQLAVFTSDPDPSTLTLTRGQNRWDWVGSQGGWKYYKVLITEESPTLKVTLDGGTCSSLWPCDRSLQLTVPRYGFPNGGINVDLYTQPGSKPTLSAWNCRPYDPDSDEVCTMSTPSPGIWYIGVNVYWRYSTDTADSYFIKAEF